MTLDRSSLMGLGDRFSRLLGAILSQAIPDVDFSILKSDQSFIVQQFGRVENLSDPGDVVVDVHGSLPGKVLGPHVVTFLSQRSSESCTDAIFGSGTPDPRSYRERSFS